MSNGKRILRSVLIGFGLILLLAGGIGVGMVARIFHARQGETTGGGSRGFLGTVQDMTQVAIQPKEGFPGQDRVTILGMGIDDNWTNKDMVYTAGARTDTLFLLTLDLQNHKATMLSIPRDTYAHIAGTKDRYFKINEAYSTGGPQRAIATVEELTGVHADHYMVLSIDATKKLVDALGGVDVTVEHEMHRHDHWGHFAVDLLPGPQHLDGDQAVGFARYREPDAGKKPTPEDGDIRRSYRQHVLMRAMIAKGKSFANVAQAPHLIDVGLSTIRTDLTRTQLFDLAALYRGVQPDDIQTATLPGDDFRGPNGEWFFKLYPDKMKAYVNWLVRGDDTAARSLVSVVVKNGTGVPNLAQHAVDQLKEYGYTDVRNGGNAPRATVRLAGAETGGQPSYPQTAILDTGVPDPKAAQDIALLLGLTGAKEARQPSKPNKVGWTPPATVTVTLGQDYAQIAKSREARNVPPASAPSGPL